LTKKLLQNALYILFSFFFSIVLAGTGRESEWYILHHIFIIILFKSLMAGSYYKLWIIFYFFGFNNNKWKIFDFSLFLFASFEHKLLSVCNNKEYALFSTGTRTVR
jgi:hypothetical protein